MQASVPTAEHLWWAYKHSLEDDSFQDVSQNTAIKTYSSSYNQRKLEQAINTSQELANTSFFNLPELKTGIHIYNAS